MKETVLILLLSDSEVIIQRTDPITPPHHGGKSAWDESSNRRITWGELESHGGVILDPLPNQDEAYFKFWKVWYYIQSSILFSFFFFFFFFFLVWVRLGF